MHKGSLSVCIPNYNHAKYIGSAIEAHLSQPVGPAEIIVVDDASTDSSVRIIQEMAAKDDRVKLLRNETNQGCNNSTNRALAAATGDYIFLQGADDYVLPGSVEKMVDLLDTYPAAGIGIFPTVFVDPEGNRLTPSQVPVHHTYEADGLLRKRCSLAPADVRRLLRRQPWFVNGGPGYVVRRNVILEAGCFISELGVVADWFVANFAALKYGMAYTPEALVAFRVMAGGYGSSVIRNPDAVLAELRHVVSALRDSRFGGIFTPQFIQDKEREFSYRVVRGGFVCWHRDFFGLVNRFFPPRTILDRVFFNALHFISKIEQYVLRAYCKRNYRSIFPQI
jgi:glycosyltransferase involved in cell wall biosynthesis